MVFPSTKLRRETGEKFNYADYLTWPEGERWEIIEGVVSDMSPASGTEHQAVSFRLSGILYGFLKEKRCKAFAAPFDVRLAENRDVPDENIETVVQPDIVVVCDQEKLDKRGCLGAPDIAVEILSPATSYKDQTDKLALYEKHRVKEYWIVNPDARYVMVYRLKGYKYGKPDYLVGDDMLESRVLQGLKIDLCEIWP
jgi:Uma2 family endonuclease